MGGLGSGRWGNRRKKVPVERCRTLQVSALIGDTPPTAGRSAVLEWRTDTGDVLASLAIQFASDRRVVLGYAWGDDRRTVKLPLDLIPVATPNGGTRYLARCPLTADGVRCQRWVARLYQPPASPYFGCRSCHRLTYRSTQRHDPRVTGLLRNGRVFELLKRARELPTRVVGLVLLALKEDERRFERALARAGARTAPRRRKKP